MIPRWSEPNVCQLPIAVHGTFFCLKSDLQQGLARRRPAGPGVELVSLLSCRSLLRLQRRGGLGG